MKWRIVQLNNKLYKVQKRKLTGNIFWWWNWNSEYIYTYDYDDLKIPPRNDQCFEKLEDARAYIYLEIKKKKAKQEMEISKMTLKIIEVIDENDPIP